MLVNKWIMFALSFAVAGISGAAWSGVGVTPEQATAIATIMVSIIGALHLSAPGPSQEVTTTGNTIVTHN